MPATTSTAPPAKLAPVPRPSARRRLAPRRRLSDAHRHRLFPRRRHRPQLSEPQHIPCRRQASHPTSSSLFPYSPPLVLVLASPLSPSSSHAIFLRSRLLLLRPPPLRIQLLHSSTLLLPLSATPALTLRNHPIWLRTRRRPTLLTPLLLFPHLYVSLPSINPISLSPQDHCSGRRLQHDYSCRTS